MDGLTDDERILAWRAAWRHSFDGWAIVNADFTFRSANQQFCDILKVTPAELIGKRFQDITSAPLRQLDENNARMIQAGMIDHYILEKEYEFSDGRKVGAVLLVTRVPRSEDGTFLFYLSRIIPGKEKPLPSELSPQEGTESFTDFLIKNYKALVAIGASIGAGLVVIIEKVVLR